MKTIRTRTSARILVSSIAALLAGLTASASAATFVWNVTSGTWDTATANWTGGGSTWVDGNDAIFSNTATASVITLSGTRSATSVLIGNTSTNNANFTFTGGTLSDSGALIVQGYSNNGSADIPTTTFNNATVSVAGNLGVGRASLVISGSSVVTADVIGGNIAGVSSADWGYVTIQDSAVVTATGGVNGNTEAWGLRLNGGTLNTPSIQASDREDGNGALLRFNGTRVVATASNASFVTVGANYNGTNSAFVDGGGAIFDSSGNDIGIAVNLKNGGGTDGGLTKLGAGTLTLSGANTYTGKTIIQAGTLKIGNVNGSDSVALTNAGVAGPLGAPTGANATIDLWNDVTLLLGSTEPRVNQETDRTINLAGTGAGTVAIKVNDNDTNFTFGAVTATGTGAKLLDLYTGYQGNGDREKMTFNGPISENPGGGPLSLQVTYQTSSGSTSVVNLKEGGTFTGPITLVNGNGVNFAYLTIGGVLTPIFFSTDVTNDYSGSGTLNGGSYAGAISLDTNTILYYNSTSAQTLSGVISGAGSVTKDVAGSTLTLTGANTYTGATSITAGTLKAGVASVANTSGAFGNNSAVSLSDTAGAILDITGFNTQVGSLTGGGTTGGNVTLGAATLTVGGDNTSPAAYAGLFSGTGAITKIGAGTQIFSGANSYTGATTVSAGTLSVVTSSTAIWKSSVAIAAGATFNWNVTGAQGIADTAGNYNITGAGLFSVSGTGRQLFSNGTPVVQVNMSAGGQIDVQGSGTILEFGYAHNAMGGNLGSLNVATGASYRNSDASAVVDALTGSGVIGNAYSVNTFTLTVGASNTVNNAAYGVSSNTATFSGVIKDITAGDQYNGQSTGSTALTKTGTGTQILSGANTYTGSTTINGGGLTLTGSGLIAAASNIQVNSGTLTITDGGGGRTFANNMVLNGGMVQDGLLDNVGTGGTITLSGGNVIHTFTASGSLVLPVSIGSASELIVGAGGGGGAGVYFDVYNAGGGGGKVSNLAAQTLASGTTAVVVGAGGAGGDNASGQDGGASSIGGNTAAGGSGANDNNGTGGTSGSGNLGAPRNNGYFGGGGGGDSAAGSGTNGGAGTAGTITGSFYGGGGGAGPNGVGVNGGGNGDGSGIGTVGAANTGGGGGSGVAGGSGIAIVQYAYAAGGAGAVTLSGTIDLQSASTLNAYGTGGLLAVSGLISTSTGSGGLTIASSNTSGGVVRFGAANTYLGNTTVNSGATLRMNTTNALPSGSGKGNLSLSGTLDLNGQATTSLNGFSGTGTIDNQTGAGTYALSVGNNDQTSTFDGVIQNTTGTIGLTKVGAGTTNFGPAGSLAGVGNLTAEAGTTNVNSVLGTGTSAVSVAGATTTLKFGSVSQTLSSLTIGAGSTVTFTSGLASFSGGGSGGKALKFGGGTAVVPEPGTLGLLLVGALGMLNRRRRDCRPRRAAFHRPH